MIKFNIEISEIKTKILKRIKNRVNKTKDCMIIFHESILVIHEMAHFYVTEASTFDDGFLRFSGTDSEGYPATIMKPSDLYVEDLNEILHQIDILKKEDKI